MRDIILGYWYIPVVVAAAYSDIFGLGHSGERAFKEFFRQI
jgi:hypothetical protein